uniref:Uncharacterized protein n=1 Tax=Emiliania huxleyi TaxID=2903 RepID=A0A6V2VUJ1_EMIHU
MSAPTTSRIERDDEPPRPSLGIALNGGGARAHAGSWGFMRAMHHLGLLSEATHISGVSGSGWTVAHLAYSSDPLDEVLTTSRLPTPASALPDYSSKEGRAELEIMPWGRLGASTWISIGDYTKLRSWTLSASFAWTCCCDPHEFWLWMIDQIYLKPNGVDGRLITASSEAAVEKAIAAAPRLRRSDFIVQRPDVRAQPIISFALAGPSAPRNFTHARRVQRAHWQATGDDDAAEEYGDAHAARAAHGGASFVTFEATPDEVSTGYKGPPMQTDVSCCCLPCVALPAPSLAVQPGTVPITRFLQPASFQCCGFPSAAPPCLYPWSLPCFCGRPNTYCGPPAFTLRDVVGTTSSALGDFVRGGVGRDGCLNDCLLDRATDWAAQNWALQRYRVSPSFDGRRAQDLLFVDGGMHDCSALPALLRRKCTRVVQFFSGPQPYATLAESGGALWKPVDSHISSLFGIRKDERRMGGYAYSQNKLFEVSAFREMVAQFDSCRAAGRPLIAELRGIKVLENDFYGVEAYGPIDLVVHYMDAPKRFTETVPDDVLALGGETFPMLASGGGYTCAQANLVADMVAWSVLSEADKFRFDETRT